MLSIDLIRKDPEYVKNALRLRGEENSLDVILDLDVRRREGISAGDELRSRRNSVSRKIGELRGSGQEVPSGLVHDMRQVGDRITELEQDVKKTELSIQEILMALPNMPRADVPPGLDEDGNIVLRHWGDVVDLPFDAIPHWDLGEQLGIIDFQRGVKLSGSRFYTLAGAGAKLERALIAWMLDLHSNEHGYTEMMLPILVRRNIMEGSGNLPKFADNLYHDEEDDLWLVPTAEVPMTNLHRDEILDYSSLPLYYVAHTPCFRREKASAGKETRGIKRVHKYRDIFT